MSKASLLGALGAVLASYLLAGGLAVGAPTVKTVLPAAASVTGPATPPPVPPMRVILVHDDRPGCEPNCGDWISAEGQIGPETPSLFRHVFKLMGKRQLPIFISSNGGAVDAAMEIGREIRARKLDVAVVSTLITGCAAKPESCKDGQPTDSALGVPLASRAFCASACPLILAGGVRRIAPLPTNIGVHQIWDKGTYTRVWRQYWVTRRLVNGRPVEVSRKLLSEKTISSTPIDHAATDRDYRPIAVYLKSMGIDEAIMPLMRATEHTSIHWMSRDELSATHLITEEKSGETLLPATDKDAALATMPGLGLNPVPDLLPTSQAGPAVKGATLPKMPVVALKSADSAPAGQDATATAQFVLVQAGQKQLRLDVTVTHGKSDLAVGIELQPVYGDQTLDTGNLSADVHFTSHGNNFVARNWDHSNRKGPLTAKIPVADFCQFTNAGLRTLQIVLDNPYGTSTKLGTTLDF